MNITQILTELRAERDRLDHAISAIQSLNSTNHRQARTAGRLPAPKRHRRPISAAARAKLSRLMKQRWAQGKMKTTGKPSKASTPVRKMRQAARNRIAAAQRARWAKAKAQKTQKKTA